MGFPVTNTSRDTDKIRNIAIVAHVDHGKTTLVDKLLTSSGTLQGKALDQERVMDSNDLEKERGITILAKNTSLNWSDYCINIVDTPGHADFGGEVERALTMVDAVVLLVDAVEGPMPQTRFVTEKAFARGLKPIVVINKIDRDGARPDWVVDQVFDLFDNLGATDEQLDFPIVYASALQGVSGHEVDSLQDSMDPLFETIVKHVPAPDVEADGPFQLQVSALDYSTFVGVIGIGRVTRGSIKTNQPVTVVGGDGSQRNGRVLQVIGYHGLDRVQVTEAHAGDIICVTGVENLRISDTLCDVGHAEALPTLVVDKPTVSMTFQVNTSPFAGQDGKYLTSRQIRERLEQELIHNVALRVDDTGHPDKFRVSGRGEMHLSVLIENMRREGYELGVSRPEVIFRDTETGQEEPFERVAIDIEEGHQGAIMTYLGERCGELLDMSPDGKGRVRLDYMMPSRGLIGFRSHFMTLTSGTGLLSHSFDHYAPVKKNMVAGRNNGVLISNGQGKSLAFALFNLQDRGRMMISPGTEVYEGMILGIHSRSNDLVVNPLKAKQLTNIRAAGTDENMILTPPVLMTLEQALEFINDDELVEVTPSAIRLRKKLLKEHERKRASREAASS